VADGLSMRIRVEGPTGGKRRPLVFIHGAGGAATVWLDLFRHFERDRLVVAPDLPGHGQSDPWHDVADADRVAHYRDAVGVACAHLKISGAVLVGHSLGGLVALAAAAAHPDKVAGVVLVAAAAGMKPAPELLAALAARPTHQAEILGELGWSPSTAAEVRQRWFRTVTGAPPELVLADLRAVAAYDARAILPQVAARVLLLGGQDDLLCPPILVQATAAALPAAEVRLIADAGHHPHLEQPAQAIETIESFTAFV
jgi:pimeloyl-ACP methyl ester carboxylesterase